MSHRPFSLPVWWWLVPVLLLTFWLGARSLTVDSIWHDEYFSVFDAGGGPFERRSPLDIWNGVTERHGVHPPGFYVVLSVWGAHTGWEVPILRSLSLFAGVLATAWTYRLGKDLLSARAGLYAAAVLGTSALFVYYMHEMRMYTLLALFTTMTLWHYLYIMNPRSRPHTYHWLGLILSAVGALYSHYFALPVLGAIAVYHLVFAHLIRHRWRGIGYSLVLAGLLFIPWLQGVMNGVGMVAENDELHEKAFTTSEAAAHVLKVFSNNSPILLAVAGAAALLALVRLRLRQAGTLWYFAIVVLAFMLVINVVLELFTAGRIRYAIPMWPLLALLVGLGLVTAERWRFNHVPAGRVLVGVLLAAWLVHAVTYTLERRYNFPVFPYHLVTDALRDRIQTRDMVIRVDNNAGIQSTDPRGLFWHYYLDPLAFDTAHFATTTSERVTNEQHAVLQSLADQPRSNLWVVYHPGTAPTYLPTLRAALELSYAQCTTDIWAGAIRIEEYARSSVCCSTERDASNPVLRYTNGIALLNVAPLPETVAGDTLEVSALWHVPPDVPANAYSVSFQVYDAARVKVAQADVTLDAVAFACSSVDVTLPALDAGDYTVEAVVYAWETGERLTGTRLADSTSADLFTLGAFHSAG